MDFHSLALASELCHHGRMTIGKGKRPRDPNQLAKFIVDSATGQIPEPDAKEPAPAQPVDLSAYMAAIGRKGGQIGGKRRLTTMTKEQRKRVAAVAAKARWGKRNDKNRSNGSA